MGNGCERWEKAGSNDVITFPQVSYLKPEETLFKNS
jgi:hypothetical protein